MNFLAHFHLAWPDSALLAGALEGDYLKGPLQRTHPLAPGIRLHRSIDAFTDQHPVIIGLKPALPAHLRRFSGILVDLAFDHYLTLHWSRFSNISLRPFSHRVYDALDDHDQHLSTGASHMRMRLRQHDILGLYHDWRTVTGTAERIGNRLKRGNPFTNLDRDLAEARPALEQAFLAFYPALCDFAREQREQTTSSI